MDCVLLSCFTFMFYVCRCNKCIPLLLCEYDQVSVIFVCMYACMCVCVCVWLCMYVYISFLLCCYHKQLRADPRDKLSPDTKRSHVALTIASL